MSFEASSKKGYWKVRGDPGRVTTSKCPAIHTALRRLSDSQYELLESFRSDYPSLHLECMGKPTNAFLLFRSHFVARVAKQSDQENDSKVNQSHLSSQAGKVWQHVVPPSTKKPHQGWAIQIRKLWDRMYPHGFPPTAMKGNASKPFRKHAANPPSRRKSQPSNRAKYPKKASSSSSSPSRPKFQPLPSPPVSDDVDFEEGVIENYSDEEVSFYDGSSDSDDGEYFPTKSSRRSRSSAIATSTQKRPEHQLLTPALTTRELSPSPSPVFSDPVEVPEHPPSSPIFHDVSLAELNDDDEYSTFPNCLIPSEFCMTHDPFGYCDQIAVGYSFQEHTDNTITDWDQTDLMPDIDPVGLHPIINIYYPFDTAMADITHEFGSNLDLSRLS